MKKIIILLGIALLITGCSIERLDYSDVSKTVEKILSQKRSVTNTTSRGYSYYLPRGVRRVETEDYNEILYASSNQYYLYVDVIAYYNKMTFDFKENKKSYLSQEIKYKDKKGYIEITELKDKYFVEILYNYAKIETLVVKEDINKVLIDASYILSTIKYNKIVIEAIIENEYYVGKEEIFNLFEPRRKEGNFLDYINEYDTYQGAEEGQILDEDQLQFEEEEDIVIE